MIISKYSGSTGAELWHYVPPTAFDGQGAGMTLAINPAGDVFAGGRLWDNPALCCPDFAVLKQSGLDGSETWRQWVPSVAAHGGAAVALTLDGDGNVVAAGYAVTGGGWCDWVVAKFDPSDGTEKWRTVFDGRGHGCDNARALDIDPNEDVVATGTEQMGLFVTMKSSGIDGSLMWRHDIENLGKCTGGGCAGGGAVKLGPHGDAFVTGNDPIGDIIIARLAAAGGGEIWRRVIDYDGCGDGPSSMDVDTGGNVAIGGRGFQKVGGVCAWPQGSHYIVLKLNGSDGTDFTAPVCGNGALESGEECDDGNSTGGDGCSASCLDEFCGDGQVQPELGEECDDGNTDNGDDCSSECMTDLDGDGIGDRKDNCPAMFNPGQDNRDGDAVGDACDPFPDNPDNEQAQCELDLGQALRELDHCGSDLDQCVASIMRDSDGDRIPDPLDICPDTAPGVEVDHAGCSLDQFCTQVDATAKYGTRRCRRSDWKNDEPMMRRRDRDCTVDRGRAGRGDNRCVPRSP